MKKRNANQLSLFPMKAEPQRHATMTPEEFEAACQKDRLAQDNDCNNRRKG